MRKYLKFFLIFTLLTILFISVSCTGKTDGQSIIKQIASLFNKENTKPQESSSGNSISTETSATLSDEEFSIQLVQWSLTKELPKEKNKWKSVKHGIGYVVIFEDLAYWYVEKDSVYNLNDLAGTYTENNKKYYGIEWEKLFVNKPEATTQESQATETTPASAETTIQQETAETTIQGETTETTVSSVFKFFNINTLPDIWGNKIRIIDPALISFNDFVVEPISNEIQVTGKIVGNSYIKYCLRPDLGIYTQISAVISDKNGNMEWKQDGYPIGEGEGVAYIKADEAKNFQLSNSYIKPVNIGDTLIIIAYIEGGMPEDSATISGNIDKGVYGVFIGNIE